MEDRLASWAVWAKGALSLVIGAVIALIGGWDVLMQVLFLFIVFDYLGGVTEAILKKNLDSSIGYKGIIKKASYFMVVIVAAQLDRVLQGVWSPDVPQLARSITIMFLVVNEGLSILEHAAAIGVPIPKFLIDLLSKLHDQAESTIPDVPGA